MFSASKLWKSSSISGPSAISKPARSKDLLDAQSRLRDRMQSADALAASGQRDIDGAGGERPLDRGALELSAPRLERLLQPLPWRR